jgi:arylformamidase
VTPWKMREMRWALVGPLLSLLLGQASFAGPIRDRIIERRATRARETMLEDDASQVPAALPAGIRIVRDVPYGDDERQRFDVYGPAQAQAAPIIFMVHGGGWRFGSKSARAVIENKVARWVPMGFVFISTDYRLLPNTDPVEQARDVARAVAVAQDKAAAWGADRRRLILMGHSAGAHLVSLLATDRSLWPNIVDPPWLGVVALDSAALDVVEIMQGDHLRLYDAAFGGDPKYWRSASPLHALTRATAPMLAVCSARRNDSCRQARRFAEKAASLGVVADVLEKDLSHKDINQQLGKDPSYTAEVETFMAALDKAAARALAGHSGATPDTGR